MTPKSQQIADGPVIAVSRPVNLIVSISLSLALVVVAMASIHKAIVADDTHYSFQSFLNDNYHRQGEPLEVIKVVLDRTGLTRFDGKVIVKTEDDSVAIGIDVVGSSEVITWELPVDSVAELTHIATFSKGDARVSSARTNSAAIEQPSRISPPVAFVPETDVRPKTAEAAENTSVREETGASPKSQIDQASGSEIYPTGRWLVILGSYASDEKWLAGEKRKELKRSGIVADLNRSSRFPNLTPDLIVLTLGPNDKATARERRQLVIDAVPDAFIKAAW